MIHKPSSDMDVMMDLARESDRLLASAKRIKKIAKEALEKIRRLGKFYSDERGIMAGIADKALKEIEK